jgi:hypothetical protein
VIFNMLSALHCREVLQRGAGRFRQLGCVAGGDGCSAENRSP